MADLATMLLRQGHAVSVSCDNIEGQAKDQLGKHQLLPSSMGWHPEKIDASIQLAILGPGAREDNPELLRAQSLGLPVQSFPAFIYAQCVDKQRIVACGGNEKATLLALVAHVLSFFHRKFDYVMGTLPEGLESRARLTDDAPIILIEGAEKNSSAVDPTPSFLNYQHHIAVITDIPQLGTRVEAEREIGRLADASPKGGTIIYNKEVETLGKIAGKERPDVLPIGYGTHEHVTENGVVYLVVPGKDRVPTQLSGKQNLQNISAARELLKKIGITNDQFYKALPSFKGVDESRGR